MTDEQRKFARKHLDGLISQVPNFVERVKSGGDLRNMAMNAIQAATEKMRRDDGKPNMAPTYGLLPTEAELVVDDFVEEMTGGRLASRFNPTEEPEE